MQIWILIFGLVAADPSSRVVYGGDPLKIERVEILAESRAECEKAAKDWTYNNVWGDRNSGGKPFAACAGRKP